MATMLTIKSSLSTLATLATPPPTPQQTVSPPNTSSISETATDKSTSKYTLAAWSLFIFSIMSFFLLVALFANGRIDFRLNTYPRARPQTLQNQAPQSGSSEDNGPIDFAETIEMQPVRRRSSTQIRDSDEQNPRRIPSPTIRVAPWALVVQQHNERQGAGDSAEPSTEGYGRV